jgi:hypothetical protein
MHTTSCPSCSGAGNPANFGGTCDPCREAMNTRTIDLRTAEQADQQAQAELRREVYAR